MVLFFKEPLSGYAHSFCKIFGLKKFWAKKFLAGNISSISIPRALTIPYLLIAPWAIPSLVPCGRPQNNLPQPQEQIELLNG